MSTDFALDPYTTFLLGEDLDAIRRLAAAEVDRQPDVDPGELLRTAADTYARGQGHEADRELDVSYIAHHLCGQLWPAVRIVRGPDGPSLCCDEPRSRLGSAACRVLDGARLLTVCGMAGCGAETLLRRCYEEARIREDRQGLVVSELAGRFVRMVNAGQISKAAVAANAGIDQSTLLRDLGVKSEDGVVYVARPGHRIKEARFLAISRALHFDPVEVCLFFTTATARRSA